MRFDVITIFPEMFPGPLDLGVVRRAREQGLFELVVHDLRRFADPPHYKVDDETFGGGCGMVYKPEPVFRAVEAIHELLRTAAVDPGPLVLLSPQGERLEHAGVARLAAGSQMTLLCARYEGVDERVREHLVDAEVSIGDYVLTGGELPAMVLIDAVARLHPAALGDPDSARQDSFADGLLDHPHYTRPAEFRGWSVPEVLRSGNHAAIAAWRRQEALRNTARKRPDLLEAAPLEEGERRMAQKLAENE